MVAKFSSLKNNVPQNFLFYGVLLLFIGILIGCSKVSKDLSGKKRPNIIYILADDMGYGELGSYGQTKIKTPNLDMMAKEGIRFTNHYAGSSVCAPSRGSLMTGLHTGNAYVKGNFAMDIEGNLPIPDSTITVPELLKKADYRTAMIGKWGLGGPGSEGGPNSQGFDYSFGYLDQRNAHEYYPPYLWENEHKVMLDNQKVKKEYSHDLFTQKALQFIEKQNDQPFFLYLPYTIPHGKFEIPNDAPYTDKNWNQQQKNIAAMISLLDRDVGRILQLLKDKGIQENTVVFFSSDNGPTRTANRYFNSNGSFQGIKRDLYEGGIRVPLIAWWPGTIKSGLVSDHISAFWDFLPTVCELTGIPSPTDSDGISFLPTLLGEKQPKHEYLYWEFFKYHYGWEQGDSGPRNSLVQQAARMGKWKGIRTGVDNDSNASSIQLFNLEKDIEEENNIATQHPEIVEKMKEIMRASHKDTEFFKAAF